jgi:hypothetical protein
MTPVDQFFTTVRDVFAKNRDLDWTQIGLTFGAALVVAIACSMWLRAWRSSRRIARRIEAVASAARLTSIDGDYLGRMAAAAGLPVLEVMTSLAPFEHATAAALAAEAPTLRPLAGSAFERVRHLRRALGFSPLSPHLWLLTTRELVEGDRVAMGAAAGRVVEVNEASFAIDLPVDVGPVPGASVPLAIDRPDDARYLAQVRVLAVEVPPGTASGAQSVCRAFFAHDEQPDRQQQREHVRVRVQGTVTVQSMDPASAASRSSRTGAGRTGPPAVTGTLVDVSAGGLALDLPTAAASSIRRGAHVRCSFTLGEGETFEELAALVVAAAAGPRPGTQHIRVSFTALAEPGRDRLAAALAKHQRRV